MTSQPNPLWLGVGVALIFNLSLIRVAQADELIHGYEGDVLPYDPSAGWLIFQPCENTCSESIGEAGLTLIWTNGKIVRYAYRVASPPLPPPPSLWIEWRFRSDLPRAGGGFFGCDADVSIRYVGMREVISMFGDAASNFEGGQQIFGLDIADFHTYRFESLNGYHYRVAVDGRRFVEFTDDQPSIDPTIQFGGRGGCTGRPPIVTNEWDFVRFGTIGFGEQVVGTDPPAGVLDAIVYGNLDRFLVTFDAPNYVYINDIAVEVIGAPGTPVPQVIATRRRDNGNPEDVEIVLDRPLPAGATTRFTLTDGVAVNVIEYTLTAALDGACCQADGTCETTTDPPCTLDGGTFVEGESCTAPQACCLASGLCQMLDPVCCAAVGGTLSAEAVCEGDADFDGVDGSCGDPCPLDALDDADGDGVCWPEDQCPDDPLKTDPGVCGCHVSDTDDSDADGVPDCIDVCPGVDDAMYAPHCATAIPAATTWGAAILALLLLTAGKLSARRYLGRG